MPTGFEDYFVTDPNEAWKPSPITGLPAGIDPFWSDLGKRFGIFGGDEEEKPKWTQDSKGNWTYTYKGKPVSGYGQVPATDIPGAGGVPSKAYRQVADQVRTFTDLFPYLSKATAGEIIPQEQAKLEAAKRTSPEMAQLMTYLYSKFGPQLNEIGNQIALQNALASAERDKTVLEGPGQDLVKKALETAKMYDPEFFATRELTSGRIGDLLKSINLGQGLSPVERREIEQGLSREGQQRGTAGAPSNTETIAGAVQYGQAGRAREMENKTALANAIAASTAFLPASRSGVDVFQVATGKPSGANTGENKFTGINAPGQEAYQLGQGLFGNIGNASSQQANISATAKLNEKDWLDQFSQFSGALGNLGGALGGAFG